jgi:hypothetical protein
MHPQNGTSSCHRRLQYGWEAFGGWKDLNNTEDTNTQASHIGVLSLRLKNPTSGVYISDSFVPGYMKPEGTVEMTMDSEVISKNTRVILSVTANGYTNEGLTIISLPCTGFNTDGDMKLFNMVIA